MMKKQDILLIFIAVLLGTTACEKQSVAPELNPKTIELSSTQHEVLMNGNAFGLKLFRQIHTVDSEENMMISPISMSMALGMTLNGAAGNTRQEMIETLEMQGFEEDQINRLYQQLLAGLLSVDSRVDLSIANSIWYRNDFNILEGFKEINRRYFDAEVNGMDFSDPQTLTAINNWVSEATSGKIPDIVDEIRPDHVMFLINAIYFKGQWFSQFDEAATQNQPFYLANGQTVNTPFMNQTFEFNYMENSTFKAIEMPYGRGNFVMQIYLPQSSSSLSELVNSMTMENWTQWQDDFSPTPEVNVFLPKFSFSYEKELKEILRELGMVSAFDNTANFTLICPAPRIFIDKVKHKTFIEVNEEGTEAAAATSVEMAYETSSAGVTFMANRPFVFVIKEQTTGAILFAGQLNEPVSGE